MSKHAGKVAGHIMIIAPPIALGTAGQLAAQRRNAHILCILLTAPLQAIINRCIEVPALMIPLVHQDVPAQQEVLQALHALPAIKEHLITIIATAAHMQEALIQIIAAAAHAVPAQREVLQMPSALPAIKEHLITIIATVAHMEPLTPTHHAVLYVAPLTILTPVPVMMFIGIIHAEQKKTKKKNAVTGQGGITYINAMATNHKEGIGQEDALATVATLLQIIGRIGAVPAQAIKFAQAVPA